MSGLVVASVVRDVLYGSAVGPVVIGLVVGGLVLMAAMHAAAAPAAVSIRRRVRAHLPTAALEDEGTPVERARQAFSKLGAGTEQRFSGWRAWQGLRRLVERSGLRLSTAEFSYLSVGSALVAAILVTFLGAPVALGFMAFLLGGSAPFVLAMAKARRREQAFDEQLPDVLLMLASSLKVGHSFAHAVQAVADQGRPPASEEFARMQAETQFGKPFDEALADLGTRIRSENLAFVLTAVTIQREVGGSLANLFEVVAETVRERQQLARKLRSLTAMGRASAGVLVALPFVAALGLSALSPGYMQPLYTSSTGHALIVLGFVMIAIGSLLLKRIVSLKG
jgi:tight adherence protein B